MPRKGVDDQYEDFYERAFTTTDIDKIYEEGGSVSIDNFFKAARDNIKDKGYYKVLRYKVTKRKRAGWTVGGLLWDRYFKDARITQNKADRIIVRGGEQIKFKSKIYKGGQYLPKAYFQR